MIKQHTDFRNQHFIPQMMIRNFSNLNPSGRTYYTNYIDFSDPEQEIQHRSPEHIFCKDFMYDVEGDDPSALEKAFNTYVEAPMRELVQALTSDEQTVELNRNQLNFIKKYMLMQKYRTAKNREGYGNPSDLTMVFTPEIKDGSTGIGFWKKVMTDIVTKDWGELKDSEIDEVRTNHDWISSCFMMFVRTYDGFVLPDTGTATERHMVRFTDDDRTDAVRAAAEGTGLMKGYDPELIGRALESKDELPMDNYEIFPITSEMAVLLVNPVWKMIMFSQPKPGIIDMVGDASLMWHHLTFPQNVYVNEERISALRDRGADIEEITGCFDPNDRFIYDVQFLDCDETAVLNGFLINEADSIAFRDPDTVLYSVRIYNIAGPCNKRHDLKKLEKRIKAAARI